MVTELQTLPEPTLLNNGPEDTDHYFCDYCPEDMTACGFKVIEEDWEDNDGDNLCPLCAELLGTPCFRCGRIL